MTERRNSLDAKFGNLNLQEDGNHDVIRADALTASNRTATLEEDLASIDDDVASLKEASKCFTKTVCVFSNTLIEVASGAKSSALPDPQTISDYSIATSSEEIKIMSLLQIFDQPIRCIIKAVLDDMKYGRVLWRVAERCYKQAINPFGTLNAGKHFIGLKQFQSGQTLNGDHKSERYHEQENGSDIPENVHAALHAQAEGLDEGGRKEEQLWIKFWLNILDHSPGGPTLFFPQESNHTDHPSLDNIPRYLFRAFDEKSSGKNDEKVMASPGSHKTPQGRPNDFMSLDDFDATKLLYYHLCEKWTGRQDYNDVLVSWTSSFLYAVQCAIWRHHNPQIRSTSNKICIVDTNQFPQGQFIRDLELLARCLPMTKDLGESELDFLNSVQRVEITTMGSSSYKEW